MGSYRVKQCYLYFKGSQRSRNMDKLSIGAKHPLIKQINRQKNREILQLNTTTIRLLNYYNYIDRIGKTVQQRSFA